MICPEVQKICDKIVLAVSPVKIIIFGEKKTMFSEKTREVNLCVIVDDEARKCEKKIYLAVESEIAYNVLVYSAQEWQHLIVDSTSYVFAINKKGAVVYEKA